MSQKYFYELGESVQNSRDEMNRKLTKKRENEPFFQYLSSIYFQTGDAKVLNRNLTHGNDICA